MTPTPPAGPGRELLPDVRFKVAVASAKGGVGKSTVTANLALALSRLGYRVGLMDADIYGPSQQMMMGIAEKPYVDKNDNRLLPIQRHGVWVATLGALMDVEQPAIWRGPMLMKAVDQLLGGRALGNAGFPPRRSAAGDGGRPAHADAENRPFRGPHRHDPAGGGAGGRAQGPQDVPEGECPRPRDHREIPIDPKIVLGGDSGTPIVALEPESAAARAYMSVAEAVAKSLGS